MAAMDDLSLPVHEIPSHGFVEVGEGTNREGTYNLLKRNSFTLCDIGKTNGTRTTAAADLACVHSYRHTHAPSLAYAPRTCSHLLSCRRH